MTHGDVHNSWQGELPYDSRCDLRTEQGLLCPARTLVMGVVNVTPDSFSDGGQWLEVTAAVGRARELTEQGADLIDVGGESTRPDSRRISPQEEQARILEVVAELVQKGIVVSVDTMHASTAAACLQAGARVINDISGGQYDPDMAPVIAQYQPVYICQHWRGTPDIMDTLTEYPNGLIAQLTAEIESQLAGLAAAGVDLSRVIVDPGLGFAKTAAQSWQILQEIDAVMACGYPVLVGASRKRFLAEISRLPQLPKHRDAATAAVTALVAAKGVWGVRVHDVAGSAAAVAVAREMCNKTANTV